MVSESVSADYRYGSIYVHIGSNWCELIQKRRGESGGGKERKRGERMGEAVAGGDAGGGHRRAASMLKRAVKASISSAT